MRTDLDVHSKWSGRVNLPGLRHVGRESYSEPVDIYLTALRRGMDLITISDHDTIEGGLQIAHLPHVFLSEEVTCVLPAGRCLHLGVFDIAEAHHAELSARRHDAESLFAFLAERKLPFCVNHPFSPMTGERLAGDLDWALARAPLVEALNGMMPASSNENAHRAATERGLSAVGGSDAHSLGSIARAYTTVPRARTRDEFLAGLRTGLTVPAGRSGSYTRLVADISRIFVGALIENSRDCMTGPRELARLAAVVALAPALSLLPAIAIASILRETYGAREIAGRFFDRDWAESGAQNVPLPVSSGPGE